VEASVQNLLYRRPELYEVMYPEFDEATPKMCLRMFDAYLEHRPSSILDIGCGTARDLNVLSRHCSDCWGVDYLPEMIAFAQHKRPHLHLQVGDMRTVRLGRTFDVILQLGSALMYALSDEDVDATLNTLAAHSHVGTLLIIDLDNAAGFLPGGSFHQTREREIDAEGFHAVATSAYSFDRRAQLLVRTRVWRIDGRPPIEDYCRYRMFFPAELEHLLTNKRFRVAGMFDNKELKGSELTEPTLYVAAKFNA
jgi:SAM-dependent methyltransferase